MELRIAIGLIVIFFGLWASREAIQNHIADRRKFMARKRGKYTNGEIEDAAKMIEVVK